MPEFVMNGKENPDFQALNPFTQGYIEAAFFTDADAIINGAHFEDLAVETLKNMIVDCAAFDLAHSTPIWALVGDKGGEEYAKTKRALGADFWFTRNGHGCGFWDGDWPEPYASELTEAAKGFGEVNLYLGDDGKIYA